MSKNHSVDLSLHLMLFSTNGLKSIFQLEWNSIWHSKFLRFFLSCSDQAIFFIEVHDPRSAINLCR